MTVPSAVVDPNDLEIGASAWSRTHQDSKGFVGGCVIGIDRVAGTVDVMVGCTPRQGPQTRTLAIAELDHELTDYSTRNAGIVAGNLFAWLGQLKTRERFNNAEWGVLAVRLQTIKDAGPLTPSAEMRYQADLRERLGR